MGVPKTEVTAIVSLVLGIVSTTVCGLGLLLAIPGLIVGIIARNKIGQSGGQLGGEGLARAGIIVSAISIALNLFVVVVIVARLVVIGRY